MDSQTYHTEKRHFTRMELNVDAFIESTHIKSPLAVKCIDLTAQGILLNSSEPTEVGDQIQVHIPAVHNLFAPLTATAQILRCIETKGKGYLLGAKITEMS
ncbi:MAG: PilZ domain-containing protein [Saccharospirillaceae bacterium]|nr:PilZ domain-containing protein [Pseudomonadales bacterium]NRB80222.1 PilZ domain-containing protein [Saccharospirillaceae bacterium]